MSLECIVVLKRLKLLKLSHLLRTKPLNVFLEFQRRSCDDDLSPLAVRPETFPLARQVCVSMSHYDCKCLLAAA